MAEIDPDQGSRMAAIWRLAGGHVGQGGGEMADVGMTAVSGTDSEVRRCFEAWRRPQMAPK
ncbi:hypothetical protein E2562_038513 [Oryza meyeriana var. granulata]|uniref:Uncharacterized protein n=1 Tax=Oryza meyeriana var. granulata TaxID=110450 RepID=A0A6G1EUC5_9ORYZ|nr:hypothetical protein E2562_038513 [Oryza meyeriana var. granulata]